MKKKLLAVLLLSACVIAACTSPNRNPSSGNSTSSTSVNSSLGSTQASVNSSSNEGNSFENSSFEESTIFSDSPFSSASVSESEGVSSSETESSISSGSSTADSSVSDSSVEDNSSFGNSSDSSTDTSTDAESSSDALPAVYAVTFVQEGKQTITRYVNEGETLIDIPTVQPVEGYEVAWSVSDFSNIRQNVEVTVSLTPKTYVITYELGDGWYMESKKQKVVYKAEYTLRTATNVDYTFVGWKIKGTNTTFDMQGRYELTEDIVLVPVGKLVGGEWVE